jgi:hypothetical protein
VHACKGRREGPVTVIGVTWDCQIWAEVLAERWSSDEKSERPGGALSSEKGGDGGGGSRAFIGGFNLAGGLGFCVGRCDEQLTEKPC